MARGGLANEAYYGRGILEVRSSLHLSLRLAVRAVQVSYQVGPWRAAIGVFVALDLLTWLYLRRTDRPGLAWRLPLDALDVAFWTASPYPATGNYDWAVLATIPLAVETGVRIGWRALVVPVTIAVTSAAVATLSGDPVRALGPAWIFLAMGMGVALFRYCRHLDASAEAERRRVRAAARRRAYLAGQNQVAMGASSAVDAIEGLVPVLGQPEPGSALWRLAAGWKSDLSASTAQEAKYLQVALLEWERSHNHHPDLSGLVEIRVDEGQGTALLTSNQSRQLAVALDRLDLRGPVAVALAELDPSRLPGQALRLDVGGHEVTVAADRRAMPPSLDPCPVAYIYAAAVLFGTTSPDVGAVPAPAVASGIALCAIAGVVSHRRIEALGERARLGAFGIAVLVGILLTLLSSTATVPISAEGHALLAHGPVLLLLGFIGGYYATSLPRWWMMPGAVVSVVGLSLLLFPDRSAITLPVLVASLLYGLFLYLPCRHMAATLERARVRHAAAVASDDDETMHRAFADGRNSVVGLVRQARADALRRLGELAPRLDADVARLVASRLEEVDTRLHTTAARYGSPSSTTTA